MEIDRTGQAGRNAIHILSQDRREIGVDDGRIAASDELDQRRNFVADRDLAKAERARHFRQAGLVRSMYPSMHQEDRKSTRLNSSHVEISYAVFCLKKKKKKYKKDKE